MFIVVIFAFIDEEDLIVEEVLYDLRVYLLVLLLIFGKGDMLRLPFDWIEDLGKVLDLLSEILLISLFS